MNAFKKTAVATVLVTTFIMSHAAITGDGKRFYVDGIIPNFQAVQSTLLQDVTKFNNACGPTSLLFVSNHYVRKSTGSNSPNMSTVDASKRTLTDLYAYIGGGNNMPTDLTQLRTIARDKWKWTNVMRMAEGNGVNQNLNNLVVSLTNNFPAIATLNANYSGYPLPGKRVDHVVVIFAYNKMPDENGRAWNHAQNTRNMDLIEYYEPYLGYMRTVPRKDLFLPTVNGVQKRAFNLSGFAYLQVGR